MNQAQENDYNSALSTRRQGGWFKRLVRACTRWAWADQVRAPLNRLSERGLINSHVLHEGMAWTNCLLSGKFTLTPTYYVSPERVRPPMPAADMGNSGMSGPNLDAHGIPKNLFQGTAALGTIPGVQASGATKCLPAIDPGALSAIAHVDFKDWHFAANLDHSQNTVILVRTHNGKGINRKILHDVLANICTGAFTEAAWTRGGHALYEEWCTVLREQTQRESLVPELAAVSTDRIAYALVNTFKGWHNVVSLDEEQFTVILALVAKGEGVCKSKIAALIDDMCNKSQQPAVQ
jgi:hypothetical protein